MMMRKMVAITVAFLGVALLLRYSYSHALPGVSSGEPKGERVFVVEDSAGAYRWFIGRDSDKSEYRELGVFGQFGDIPVEVRKLRAGEPIPAVVQVSKEGRATFRRKGGNEGIALGAVSARSRFVSMVGRNGPRIIHVRPQQGFLLWTVCPIEDGVTGCEQVRMGRARD